MDLPATPLLGELGSISSSFYNTALSCKAKAAWFRFAPSGAFPGTTGAILGACFHAVMELANRGQLPPGAPGATRAKTEFDAIALDLFTRAHPLLRAKFRSATSVPYYHQRRARAVAMALKVSSGATGGAAFSAPSGRGAPARTSRMHIEETFTSRDGFVTGRIDVLDEERRKITDYKSGHAPREGGSTLTENEVRQLHLYAYLARENGYDVTVAAIVRGDDTEAVVNVAPENVVREADAARALRSEFNTAAAAGTDLAELAMPAPENCPGCPCLPACEPFWATATAQWEEACGTNAEGTVSDVHSSTDSGTELVTITIDASRGSAPRGVLVVEQIPSPWLEINGDPPLVGESIRIVQAARRSPIIGNEVRALRVDRLKSTAIWRAPSPAQPTSATAPARPE